MTDAYGPEYDPSSAEHVFMLGGHDLEMVTIREVLQDAGRDYHDKNLTWGARASDYEAEIREAIQRGRLPLLVELPNNLPPEIADKVELIDHHGDQAGVDVPTSLEQVLSRLGIDANSVAANRQWQLVAANDRGHIRGMRQLDPPATDDEVRRIRLADLTAQGVSEQEQSDARQAVALSRTVADDKLTVVDCDHDRTGLIAEMFEPIFGGPGFRNLLVRGATEFGFYGEGWLVERLAESSPAEGSWFGGSLPSFGFWGGKRASLEFDPESVLVGLLS